MVPVPPNDSAAALADWAELWCLTADDSRASRAELERALADSSTGESAIDDAWHELGRRTSLLGLDYPFCADRTGLRLRQPWRHAHLTYNVMLLLSTAVTHDLAKPTHWNEEAKLFEHIATAAMRSYVSGKAHRIGSPREGAVPVGFEEMLEFLRDETNEEGPLGNILNMYDAPKDAGVDVVAWRPFRDSLCSQLILLGQCAIGGNWPDKLQDFSMERWKRYLGCVVPPVRTFLTPHSNSDPDRWGGIALDAGVFMDRMRIAEMVPVLGPPSVRRSAAAWGRTRVTNLRDALRAGGWLN